MQTQGPGTKLVLKGLKLAFPKIAEKRQQEEREEQPERERERPSHTANGDREQGRPAPPSSHHHHSQPQKPPEHLFATHSKPASQKCRNHSRDPTRSGGVAQGHPRPSHVSNNTGHQRASQYQPRHSSARPETSPRRPSSLHPSPEHRTSHRLSSERTNNDAPAMPAY